MQDVTFGCIFAASPSLRVSFLLSLLFPALGRYHHIYIIRVGFCEPAQSRPPAGCSRGVFDRGREADPQSLGHTLVKGTRSYGVRRLRQDGGHNGEKRTGQNHTKSAKHGARSHTKERVPEKKRTDSEIILHYFPVAFLLVGPVLVTITGLSG